MSAYGKPVAEGMSINPCKPNHYPDANVMGSAHNTGAADSWRTDGKKGKKGSAHKASGYGKSGKGGRAPKY